MDKAFGILHIPGGWAVSVQLLVLYCVAVGLFFAVDAGNRGASAPLRDGVKAGKASSRLFVFAIAAASNGLAVLTFVFVSRKLDTVPRLAMVGLPLLLLVEKHVRVGRAEPENRLRELLLGAGTAVGIVAAMFALMRDCPLK
jgi:hypothetical protein